MNRLKLLGLSLVVYGALVLPGRVAAADLRLGVINAVKVLEAAPQADEARKRLEKEFAPRDKGLVAKQKSLKQKEDRLSKGGSSMSESERRKLEREILDARREMKRDTDEFREDLNFRRNEEFGKIQRQVVEAIQSIAKEEGFDLILGEGVIYANDKVDITTKVIERLKKGYKAP